MLLTVTLRSTPAQPDATELGYLLHKHPDRAQRFDLPVGVAHVFYPVATQQECTAALLLEVDPIALGHGDRGRAGGHYVDDRPYAASSLLSVALGSVFATALRGRCDARPELAAAALPLTLRVPACPQRGDELATRLFAPLGWQVRATAIPLDPTLPEWGDSPYVDLTLTGTMPLGEALRHLYVLIPVLAGSKHYWVGQDEVDKLLSGAGDWLGGHPERDLITARYLAGQRSYVRDATERLAEEGEAPVSPPEAKVSLAARRVDAVVGALREVGARSVVDLGCGEGRLVGELLRDPAFERVIGVDVSARELERAHRRIGVERLPDSVRARLTLRQSSLTYRDREIEGVDAIVLQEVIEHVDPARLPALERSVFGHGRPGAVVVTTPNADYNPCYPSLPAGQFRHPDHRFEWGRAEFAAWCRRVEQEYGYVAQVRGVGDPDPERGAPTQLALLRRVADASVTEVTS